MSAQLVMAVFIRRDTHRNSSCCAMCYTVTEQRCLYPSPFHVQEYRHFLLYTQILKCQGHEYDVVNVPWKEEVSFFSPGGGMQPHLCIHGHSGPSLETKIHSEPLINNKMLWEKKTSNFSEKSSKLLTVLHEN